MRAFALIGHPLKGSLSPELFSKAYGGRWPYLLVDEPNFSLAWDRFLKEFTAINITAPFKEKAFAQVDILSPEGAQTGAINIAVKTPQGIKGYNSDFFAVRNLLSRSGLGPGSRAVVAGAGGAGRAAYAAALSLGIDTTICNRTKKLLPSPSKGGAMVQSESLSILNQVCSKADVLIYTLPISPITAGIGPLSCQIIIESVYKTPFLESAATKEYISGEKWLLEQAREGYALMTGENPSL